MKKIPPAHPGEILNYEAYWEKCADRVAESEALDWAEGTCGDVAD